MAWGSFELKAGGWVAYEDTEIAGVLCVRFDEGAGGRLELVELHLTGGGAAITSEILRRLNLGRVEAAANSPDIADELRRRIAKSPALTRQASARFASAIEPKGAVQTTVSSLAPSFVLKIPTGRKLPDDFYREVGTAFTWLSREMDNPAQSLAESNGVPVTTVHRWVKEARRRGLLAPAARRQQQERED